MITADPVASMRVLSDGSYWHPRPSKRIINYMDEQFDRVPGEYRWVPRCSGHKDISDLVVSNLTYIIGTGPSLDSLTADDFEDGSTVICINHSLTIIESILSDSDISIYGIQLDNIICEGKSPHIVPYHCRFLYSGSYIFNKSTLSPTYTSDCATAIARQAGAKKLVYYGFDAQFGGISSYAPSVASKYGITNSRTHNISYSEQETLIRRAAGDVSVEFPAKGNSCSDNCDTNTKGTAYVRAINGLTTGVVGKCLSSITAGLNNSGYSTVMSKGMPSADAKLYVIWNGIKGQSRTTAAMAEKIGAKTLFVEHGFIDRKNYSQVDTKGFLHNASWASRRDPLPDWAEGRLYRLCNPITVRPRQTGDILILGQVDGDSQLLQSDPGKMSDMLLKISDHLPPGIKAIYRPHPAAFNRHARVPKNIVHNTLSRKEHMDYNAEKQSSDSLNQALESARFVIAINSNALVEATIAGVPCLAFGPSIGLNYGAYASWQQVGIIGMLRGWVPDEEDVNYFLQSLAAHQWNNDELKQPHIIDSLIEGTLPETL